MINFHVLTLFPDFFKAFSNTSIIKKGLEKKAFVINIKDIRENALNKYGQVDDVPYGGGPGMLIRPEPIIKTYNSLKLKNKKKKCIFFSPKGKKLDNDYIIRRKAIDLNIPLITNIKFAKRFIKAHGHYKISDLRIKSWDEYN